MTHGNMWSKEDQRRLLANILRRNFSGDIAETNSHKLLRHFGSLPQVLYAEQRRLREQGIGPATAEFFGHVRETAVLLARNRIAVDQPVVSTWSELLDYCHAEMAFERIVELHVLYLDSKNRLIADEVHQVGTVDFCALYPREVIRRALELCAAALILVSNHPWGDPSPTAYEVKQARDLAVIGKALKIFVHDRIIIGRSGHASFRQLRLLD